MPTAESITAWFSDHAGALLSGALNIVIIVVLAAVARVLLGRLVTAMVKRIADSRERLPRGNGAAAERQRARAETIGSVLRSVASFTVFGVALFMVLGELGINLGPLLASAGVLGLAIGFGAQGLVKDFVSGMAMMLEDQYGVGDTVDVGEAVGTIEEVGLRITKVRDINGGLWYVRNGEILRVCNMSQGWANAVVDVPVSAEASPAAAEAAARRAAEGFSSAPEAAGALLEDPTVVGVQDIANGAMTLRVTVRTRPGEQWAVGRALRARIKSEMDADGIAMARPVPAL
ncbi:mechanosensitive ion channel family protein [Nocardiopsis suaedae]|uniref:Mechanosensitive ion channel n=1 Tax=Nocardiopsis suaedae TaxID=3018444 RepID=A0ABT4TNF0_9ACTN|nr:mechanosensitive ion channel domain-containing protein [Nocardiopsis suaedae]MDA2806218.1 mechanosensitive ion channel [Nocardiopsis suaedae]